MQWVLFSSSAQDSAWREWGAAKTKCMPEVCLYKVLSPAVRANLFPLDEGKWQKSFLQMFVMICYRAIWGGPLVRLRDCELVQKAQWNSTRINFFFFWVIFISDEGGKKKNDKPTPCPKAILQEWLFWHRQQAAREVPAQGEKCARSHCQDVHGKTKSGSSSELFSRTVDTITADGNKSVYQTERQYVLLQVEQWCTDLASMGI